MERPARPARERDAVGEWAAGMVTSWKPMVTVGLLVDCSKASESVKLIRRLRWAGRSPGPDEEDGLLRNCRRNDAVTARSSDCDGETRRRSGSGPAAHRRTVRRDDLAVPAVPGGWGLPQPRSRLDEPVRSGQSRPGRRRDIVDQCVHKPRD